MPDTKEVNWYDLASCKLQPSSYFFTDATSIGKSYKQQLAKGRKFCITCPVAGKCYEQAIINTERHGLWGGVNFHKSSKCSEKKYNDRICKEHLEFVLEYKQKNNV